MTLQRTRVWKRLRPVAICLLLGAMVNVGVAWAFAGWLPIIDTGRFWYSEPTRWPAPAPKDWPQISKMATNCLIGMRIVQADGGTSIDGTDCFPPIYSHSMFVFQTGWPMVSMHTWKLDPRNIRSGARVNKQESWEWGTRGFESVGARTLPAPLMPIPLGFTINTLFYGGILYAGVCGVSCVRWIRRRRRGLCRACGYDITGLPRCPECGLVVAGSPE